MHRRAGGVPTRRSVKWPWEMRKPSPEGPNVEEDMRVQVTGGALEGVEGIGVERRNGHRVLVGLATIRQRLEVDLDSCLLQPVGHPY